MNNTKSSNTPIFFIDSSALKDMFEGENETSNALLKKCKEMNDKDCGIEMITTSSSFLRAIYMLKQGSNIENIQKVLSFIVIAPSLADHKNDDEVTKELLTLAKKLSGKMHNE